jgi:hypothetical protein
LQRLGNMGRTLVLLTALAALAGCYNPRFPSESPTANPPPENQQDSQQNHVVRDRRDSAAGNGSSSGY